MTGFDREAPGGGVDAYTIWENQKAEIRFTVYLTEDGVQASTDRIPVEVWMRTAEGTEAAYMEAWTKCPEDGRESWAVTVRTLLIQPHLWQGKDNPYLYDVEVRLAGAQTLRLKYPVCSMGYRGEGHFVLNGRPYPLHAVRYIPGADAVSCLERDLGFLKELGANCLCLSAFPAAPQFYERCLEQGMVVWKSEAEEEQLPVFGALHGDAGAPEHMQDKLQARLLLCDDGKHKRDLFYYYQALWSERKVLHICRLPEGTRTGTTVSVTVYSNQKKVALYVNGYLQEFKESAPCFVFQDVELTGANVVLSARSEECFTSYTPELS